MGENERRRRTEANRPARSASAGSRASRERSRDTRSPGRDPARRRPAGAQDPRAAARRQRARRRRRRNMILRLVLFIILIILIAAGAFLWKRYSPTSERADLNEYYGIEKEGQIAVTINSEVLEPEALVSDGKAYLNLDIIKEYLNDRFYWDSKQNTLLYALPRDMVRVEVGKKEYSVSKNRESKDYVILKTEGNTVYLALDFVQQYTNMEYEVYDNPGRVMIFNAWGKNRITTAKRDAQVRYRGGVKSPILTDVSKGDEMIVLEDEENWRKVRTKDGFVGYIRKRDVRKTSEKTFKREFEEPDYSGISEDRTINLVWQNMINRVGNDDVMNLIASTKGLTTIAPTWYHVSNTSGDLASLSSADYVQKAHQLNVDVWATIRDFDGGISSSEETLELLSSTQTREKLINQLIADALQAGIDGINVDFEKVSTECGEHYIQFIRELAVKCHQNELVLSVDNYVPKGYNQQYRRKEQGVFADYVVIMGYDEHFGGSPEAGSVSSYNYVKEGIQETLKEVPADKIISGIPFYTRLWEETPKTKKELARDKGTENEDYTMKVTSKAYGMAAAKSIVANAGAKAVWDKETKQNYATWKEGSKTYEIWLEDTRSIEAKLKLMKKYKLAGTAAWAISQETPDVWPVIQKYVN